MHEQRRRDVQRVGCVGNARGVQQSNMRPERRGGVVRRGLRPRADASDRMRELRDEHTDLRCERHVAGRRLHRSRRLRSKRDGILQHQRDADVQLELHVGRLFVRFCAGVHAERKAVLRQRRRDMQRLRPVGRRSRVLVHPNVRAIRNDRGVPRFLLARTARMQRKQRVGMQRRKLRRTDFLQQPDVRAVRNDRRVSGIVLARTARMQRKQRLGVQRGKLRRVHDLHQRDVCAERNDGGLPR
jgi:hypothetical protein